MLPRAYNAIFRETNIQGDLEFDELYNDPNRPDNERGHVSTGAGDSGMPLWRKLPDGNAELVGLVQGIVSPGGGQPDEEPDGSYGRDQDDRNRRFYIFSCTNIVTKITQEIKNWIYRISPAPPP